MEKNEINHRNLQGENKGNPGNDKKVAKRNVAGRDLAFAIISFVILLSSGIVVYVMYHNLNKKHLSLIEVQQDSFNEQLTSRDSMINEWVLTFDEIEKDLNLIKEKEKIINVRSADSEFTPDKKQQILADIQFINTLLEENKKKIASLNNQLLKSGGTIKVLQNKMADLEESIRQRESEIAALKTDLVDKEFEIGLLNTRMAELNTIVAQQDEHITYQSREIASREDEMNTAFLAYGTFKDLKERGLVSKEGGFLGIGRKGTLVENFDESSFTQVRINETRTIPVHSKNMKFITTHPVESYELLYDDESNHIAFIEIKNPDQFWKVSKYAVVEINK